MSERALWCEHDIGKRFGRLVVLEIGARNERNTRRIRCQCDCGHVRDMEATSLRRGRTVSCGCVRRERQLAANTKHGFAGTPTYRSWHGMIDRCYDPKCGRYSSYGGKGITVCDRWRHSFETFLSDMGERPEGRTLDRIDNNGNYEPANCRWSTLVEQQANRTVTRTLTAFGETLPVAEWCRRAGLNPETLSWRLNKMGLSPEAALTRVPKKTGRPKRK